jgi:hypothetical protein
MQGSEQFIETIDTRQLRHFRWPIIRTFFASFVQNLERRRYERNLLTSGRWKSVRAVPKRDEEGRPSHSLFDLYGVPVAESG